MSNIAITGIGVISSLGTGREAFWHGCCKATSGIRRITSFDTDPYKTNIGGCVADFKPSQFMSPMVYRRMSRVSRMALAAGIEAVDDSRIDMAAVDKERVAVIMGTAYGGSSHVDAFYCSLLAEGPRGAQPMLFPETVPNAPASHIAIYYKIRGPNSTFCQNDISAETGIAYAKNLLDQDLVDVAIVGGAEELSEILYGCYDAVGALSRIKLADDEPIESCPADGLILGEGAATLVMERREFARRRGATIYGNLDAVVISGGVSAMGHYDMDGSRIARTVDCSLREADVSKTDIDHISVSANHSKELDLLEYRQLKQYFGEKKELLKVTPLKYLIGNFGAAGSIRAAAVLLSLHHQTHLPTISLEMLKSDDCAPYEWETSSRGKIDTALMTSTTFGGGTASLVFSR